MLSKAVNKIISFGRSTAPSSARISHKQDPPSRGRSPPTTPLLFSTFSKSNSNSNLVETTRKRASSPIPISPIHQNIITAQDIKPVLSNAVIAVPITNPISRMNDISPMSDTSVSPRDRFNEIIEVATKHAEDNSNTLNSATKSAINGLLSRMKLPKINGILKASATDVIEEFTKRFNKSQKEESKQSQKKESKQSQKKESKQSQKEESKQSQNDESQKDESKQSQKRKLSVIGPSIPSHTPNAKKKAPTSDHSALNLVNINMEIEELFESEQNRPAKATTPARKIRTTAPLKERRGKLDSNAFLNVGGI